MWSFEYPDFQACYLNSAGEKKSSWARELRVLLLPINSDQVHLKCQVKCMQYFTYLYCLGIASWHTKLKFCHNHSEVRPESTSEIKTQDTVNGLEMTGIDIFFCYFMFSLSALSKSKTYHCLSLQNIVLSFVRYSKSKLESVAMLNLEHQHLAMNHCLKHSCNIQYILAFLLHEYCKTRIGWRIKHS